MDLVTLLKMAAKLEYGHYAECGVHRGDSAAIIAKHLAPNTFFYLFDSFEGHPAPSLFDHPGHFQGRYADTHIGFVVEKVPSAIIYKGFFPSQFHQVEHKRFRFVNCDCDLYQSTKDVLEFFVPRLVKGGIIRFDDYNVQDCPGCNKAVDEYFGRPPLNPEPHMGNAYWIKE